MNDLIGDGTDHCLELDDGEELEVGSCITGAAALGRAARRTGFSVHQRLLNECSKIECRTR